MFDVLFTSMTIRSYRQKVDCNKSYLSLSLLIHKMNFSFSQSINTTQTWLQEVCHSLRTCVTRGVTYASICGLRLNDSFPKFLQRTRNRRLGATSFLQNSGQLSLVIASLALAATCRGVTESPETNAQRRTNKHKKLTHTPPVFVV